jgi:hypothetical protein
MVFLPGSACLTLTALRTQQPASSLPRVTLQVTMVDGNFRNSPWRGFWRSLAKKQATGMPVTLLGSCCIVDSTPLVCAIIGANKSKKFPRLSRKPGPTGRTRCSGDPWLPTRGPGSTFTVPACIVLPSHVCCPWWVTRLCHLHVPSLQDRDGTEGVHRHQA